MKTPPPLPAARAAFTLIELLVVISIIGILAGLLFSAMGGVQDKAKKLQASNDEQTIVNAVKNYFTEYGSYPAPVPANPPTTPTDMIYGPSSITPTFTNEHIINVLRGLPTTTDGTNSGNAWLLNTRQIVFLEAKQAKDKTAPKNGISPSGSAIPGQWMDPWGQPYIIFVDTDYNNHISPTQFKKAYRACTDTEDSTTGVVTPGATANSPQVGVAVASFGKDMVAGTNTSGSGDGDYSKSTADDVVSWR